jgi:hypothetical protein
MSRRSVSSWASRSTIGVLACVLLVPFAIAQTRFVYNRGQSVSPAYEGWAQNQDGSFTLYFGYMNPNWREELDVPIGADNNIQPGGPDQGQPTHFYPRRNPFLFTVRVSKDFGTQELVWTLTTHGKTQKTYASLKTDYAIDNQIISTEVGGDMGSTEDKLRDNLPPDVEVDGARQRNVKVGESLTLIALAGDPDNYPARHDGKPQPRHPGETVDKAQPPAPLEAESKSEREDTSKLVFTPPSEGVPSNPPGLRLSWIVYRGSGLAVKFNPTQMETWEDDRPWANSPWAYPFVIPEPPPDGKWVTHVTFTEPGTYVLRAVASDSAVFTYENVTVTVTH